jgi:dihydroorotate dehydrogenase (NAD+) catalytic subunit
VIANIGGFSVEEYVTCTEKLAACDNVGILEINISCPNVHGGGMGFGTQASSAAEVTRAVRKVTDKPIFIKLTPNVTDITEIARAVEAEGADGISMINTLLGMRINLRKQAPLLANRTGGLSGPAIFPLAVRMVYDVYKAVKIPVVGMGGVSTAEDVLELMMAGATAVEVGAANLVDPFVCRDIINDLPRVMAEYRINSLTDIIGAAHR